MGIEKMSKEEKKAVEQTAKQKARQLIRLHQLPYQEVMR